MLLFFLTLLMIPVYNQVPNLVPEDNKRKQKFLIVSWISCISEGKFAHQITISSDPWLSCVWLFVTPWTAAHQASLSFTNSQSLLKLMSMESVMPFKHLILCRPLLLLPSIFPSIRVFSNESILHSRWAKYWASASVLPMNIQDWFPLGWAGWFSCSPRDSQESYPTPQFKSISSSALSLLYGTTLTSTHDNWKSHIFDYVDLCRQCDVSAFQYTV